MKYECRITVLETKCFPELQKKYLADPNSGPCPFFKAGDTRTRLKCRRELAGMSQSDLARRASVNIRNIQQYEQRVKDINRAAGATLRAMATVLGCRIEDILEPDVPPTP